MNGSFGANFEAGFLLELITVVSAAARLNADAPVLNAGGSKRGSLQGDVGMSCARRGAALSDDRTGQWPAGSRHHSSRNGSSAAPRRLDRGDINLFHSHHCLARALCLIAAGRHGIGHHARRDLQGDAPSVLAPATRALLAAIVDDRVPVAVGLLLIVSGDLEREGFVMFECRTAVKPDTRDAGNCEFDRQHVALLAGWVVTGRMVDGAHRTVGKSFGVEPGSSLGVLIVPDADRVLCHCIYF